MQVEHILPRNVDESWREYLMANEDSYEQAGTRLHTLGNLTLTGMNAELSDDAFEVKRTIYESSPLALNQELAKFPVWTSAEIDTRSRDLAALAVQIWLGPENASAVASPEAEISVSDVLSRIPEDEWTTVENVAEFLAISPNRVRQELDQIDPVFAVKVLDDGGRLPNWLESYRKALLESELLAAGYETDGKVFESPAPLSAQALTAMIGAFSEQNDDGIDL
jgi:hypothetical protein